jgi:hypothetical protein
VVSPYCWDNEEVGNFEYFLPALYAEHMERTVEQRAARMPVLQV